MSDEGKIYKQISLVMSEIGAIGKDRKNVEQKYSFRGIDDIYNAVNAALAKHEVFCAPFVEDLKREERQSKSGGVLFYSILTVKYTFYASDGSSVEARTIGEAMDSGDKSCNKAMSAAQKYAFLQVFCIPTEDPPSEPKDTEGQTHEVSPLSPVEIPIITFAILLDKVGEAKAIPHLQNIWTKYDKEIKGLSPEDLHRLVLAKDNKKVELGGAGKQI